MKRIITIFLTSVFMFVLAGCDIFTPDVVDTISEEYCRDNPTSSICEGESVGDLQNDAIQNIFQVLLDEYDDIEKDTFCEDYFSVTNIELLDECRAQRTTLFPSDITLYTIDSVEKDYSLSTHDVYKIIMTDNTGWNKLVFTLGLTSIDDVIYIDQFEYELLTVNPLDVDVPPTAAEAYFKQFIDDYQNGLISSELICQTYLPKEDIDNCINDRERNFENNVVISIISFDIVDNNFIALVNITGEEYSNNLTFTISFNYDETGNIVMDIINIFDENQNDLSYQDYFIKFLYEISGTQTSIERVCIDYFIDEESCTNIFKQYENLDATFEIISFIQDDDIYVATIIVYLPDNKTETIDLQLSFSEDKQIFINNVQLVNDEVNFEDLTNILNKFFTAYLDYTISDDDAVTPYIAPMQTEELKSIRSTILEDTVSMEVVSIKNENDYYIATVTIISTETTDIVEMPFSVYDDNGTTKLLFVDDGLEHFNLYIDYLTDFLLKLANIDLSDQEAIQPFIDPEQWDKFVNLRTTLVQSGYLAISLEDFYPNNEFDFTADIKINDSYVPVVVSFYYDEFQQLKMHFDDSFFYFGIDNEFFVTLITDAINAYQDSSLTNEAYCSSYATIEQYDQCLVERSMFNYEEQLSIVEINYIEPLTYELVVRHDNGNESWLENNVVVFHDDNGEFKIERQYYEPGFSIQREIIEKLIRILNDDTTQENCSIILAPDSQQYCDTLQTMIYQGYLFTYEGLYSQTGDDFVFNLITSSDNEEIIYRWHVRFLENNGMLQISIIDIVNDITIDGVHNLINQFITEFNNASYMNEEIITSFATFDSASELRYFLDNYRMFTISDYSIEVWDGNYIVSFYLSNGEQVTYNLYFVPDNESWLTFWQSTMNASEITTDEVWSIIEPLLWDYNADVIFSDSCNSIFDYYSIDRCYNELSSYSAQGFINSYILNVYQVQDYFSIEIAFTDNMNEITIIWDVYAFYNEDGILKLSFLDNSILPEMSVEDFMWTWESELLDFNNDDNLFCTQYFDESSFETCYSLRSLVRDIDFEAYITDFDLRNQNQWIEFLLTDIDNQTFYLHLDVIISQDYVTNEYKMTINNQFQMFPLEESDWQWLLNDLSNKINDSTYTASQFCEQYGFLFEDCQAIKDGVINGDYVDMIETYPYDNNSLYIRFAVINNDVWKNEFSAVLKAFYDVDGNLIVSGFHDSFDNTISLDDAINTLSSALTDFFDPTISNDALYMYFSPESLIGRDTYLQDGTWQATVNNVSLINTNGFTYWFTADITLSNGNVQYNKVINFEIFTTNDGFIIIYASQDSAIDPTMLDINSFINNFNDQNIPTELVCGLNNEFTDPMCGELRDYLVNNNLLLSWDGTGLDPFTGSIDINIVDQEDVLIATIQIYPYVINNILGDTVIQYNLGLDSIYENQLNELSPFTLDLSFNWLNNSLSDICGTVQCVGVFDDSSTIIDAYFLNIYPLDSLFSETWFGDVYLTLSDQSQLFITVNLSVSYEGTHVANVIISSISFGDY